jgi:hypothetical protein
MIDRIKTYKDKTRICGYIVPQYFWFMLSGGVRSPSFIYLRLDSLTYDVAGLCIMQVVFAISYRQ